MPADQYHRQRNQLMRKILKELDPIAPGLPEDFEPFCHNCGAPKSETNEIHIDHPHGNPEETSQDMSGWDYFYMYRRQFQGEVTLWVVCDVCHYLLHKRREDGGAEKLSNRRKYLSEYSQVDPEEELARRRSKKHDRLEKFQESEGEEEPSRNGHSSLMEEVRETLKAYGKVEEEDLIEFIDGDDDAIMNAVSELKRQGEVFEPQSGKVQRI